MREPPASPNRLHLVFSQAGFLRGKDWVGTGRQEGVCISIGPRGVIIACNSALIMCEIPTVGETRSQSRDGLEGGLRITSPSCFYLLGSGGPEKGSDLPTGAASTRVGNVSSVGFWTAWLNVRCLLSLPEADW